MSVGKAIGERFPSIRRAHSIDVISTIYRRTQLSVQALLTGLEMEDFVERGIKVRVRDIRECAMQFYEGHKEISMRLFAGTCKLQNLCKK